MVRVRRDVVADGAMTLRAGRVAVALLRELPAVGIALVHRVARQAGHRAALMSSGDSRSAVVLAPRDAHHAVATNSGWARTRRRRRSGARHALFSRVASRRIGLASASGWPGRKRMPDLQPALGRTADAVTLPAHLGRARRRQARRIDDGRIGAVAVVQRDAAERAGVGGDVRRGRPVARLAGDAELGDAARRHVGARVEARLPAGDVALDADAIPHRRVLAVLAADEEDVAARHPAAIVEEVGERELDLLVAAFAGKPERLHVMRAGHHGDAARADAGDVDPQLVAVAAQAIAAGRRRRAASRRRTARAPPTRSPPASSCGDSCDATSRIRSGGRRGRRSDVT